MSGLPRTAVTLSDMRHTHDAVQQLIHHIVGSVSGEIVKGNITPPKTYSELEDFLVKTETKLSARPEAACPGMP